MAAVKLELKRERRRSGPSVSAGRLRPATIDLIWGKSIKPGLLDDGMLDEYAFCLAAQTGEGEAIATVSQRVTLTGTIEDARPSEEPTPRPRASTTRQLARHGDRAAALAALQEGLETADATGEYLWDAELHRLTGTVLLEPCAAVGRAGPVGRTARGAKLLKLRVERLPVGADAGIAETAVLRVSFGHNLTGTMTH